MGFDLGDLTDVEPSTGGGSYTILPKGVYRLGINDVGDEAPTSSGDGTTAYIEYAVTEGEHEGETFRIFYNRKNKNPQAVEIAQRELSALGHAVGVFGGDAEELLGKTFMAKIGIKPPSVGKNGKEYGESNRIDKYYAQGETPSTAAPAALRQTPIVAPMARPAAIANTGVARPWKARA